MASTVYVVAPKYSDVIDTVADLPTAKNSARILCAEAGGVAAFIFRYPQIAYPDGSFGPDWAATPDMAWNYYNGRADRIDWIVDAVCDAFPSA